MSHDHATACGPEVDDMISVSFKLLANVGLVVFVHSGDAQSK